MAKPDTVASVHPDPVSGGAPTIEEAVPAEDKAGVGTDFRTHKTTDRGKVHRSSKHATRDRLVVRTAARTHTSRARAAYAFSQARAAYTFFWPYWFGAQR
jgi:hypothetical protein